MRQVSVLIVEDDEQKIEAMRSEVDGFFDGETQVDVALDFSSATQRILLNRYDLIILDLLLPRRPGQEPTDISDELIGHLAASENNRHSTCVAISAFDQLVEERHDDFGAAGLLLIKYDQDANWKKCLGICMQRVSQRTVFDFVIICAVGVERDAFEHSQIEGVTLGDYVNYGGLNGREIDIDGLKGVCVLQPQMGLVDAAIVATKALEEFTPSLICMSGICGGFADRTKLGRLIVTDYCWDHQAGKWLGDQFEVRSYSENLQNEEGVCLNQLIHEDETLNAMRLCASTKALPVEAAKVAPSVSGSAVIASDEYGQRIAGKHGKVAAVDMEVFSVYRAAALFGTPIKCFAAKTVVDLANEEKGDDLQAGGAILAARFTISAIKRLLL